jgi:hypothetical protein
LTHSTVRVTHTDVRSLASSIGSLTGSGKEVARVRGKLRWVTHLYLVRLQAIFEDIFSHQREEVDEAALVSEGAIAV